MRAIKKKVVSMRKIGPGAMVSLVVSLQENKHACRVNILQLGN